MSAYAPPKISTITSRVMSRIFHQVPFFFFFLPPLPLPLFFAVRLGVGGVTVTRGACGRRRWRDGCGGGFVLMVGLVGAGRFFHLDASGGGGCLVIIKGGAAALHLVHIQLLHLRTRAARLGGTITVDGARWDGCAGWLGRRVWISRVGNCTVLPYLRSAAAR